MGTFYKTGTVQYIITIDYMRSMTSKNKAER